MLQGVSLPLGRTQAAGAAKSELPASSSQGDFAGRSFEQAYKAEDSIQQQHAVPALRPPA